MDLSSLHCVVLELFTPGLGVEILLLGASFYLIVIYLFIYLFIYCLSYLFICFCNVSALDSTHSELFDVRAKFDETAAARYR